MDGLHHDPWVMASLRQEAFAQEGPQQQLSSQEQTQQFQSFMNEAAMEREATQQAFAAFQRESQQNFKMMTQQFEEGRAQYAHLGHELKQALINIPELAYPDSDLLYHLHCDASNVALGSALVENGSPVGFTSRTLTPAEKNYSTTERECLSVAWPLRYFYCYVHGATLIIYTDHAALKALLVTKDPKGRVVRWIIEIWTYEFDIQHRNGKDNQDADALSRVDVKHPITQINHQAATTMDELKKAQQNDPEIARILSAHKITYPYMIKEGIVCYKIKYDPPAIVIPKLWQQQFLKQINQHPTRRYLGREKTLARAKENGYWLTTTQGVKTFIQKCRSCQVYKKSLTHKIQQLKSIKIGEPGERWAADIAFLPVTNRGKHYLLVCMDYLTKWMATVALALKLFRPHYTTVC